MAENELKTEILEEVRRSAAEDEECEEVNILGCFRRYPIKQS